MAGIRPYTIKNGEKVYIVGVAHIDDEDVIHFFGQTSDCLPDDKPCAAKIFLRNFYGVQEPDSTAVDMCIARLRKVPNEAVYEIELTTEEVEGFTPNHNTSDIRSIGIKAKEQLKKAYLSSSGEKTFKLRSLGDKVFHLHPVGLF